MFLYLHVLLEKMYIFCQFSFGIKVFSYSRLLKDIVTSDFFQMESIHAHQKIKYLKILKIKIVKFFYQKSQATVLYGNLKGL